MTNPIDLSKYTKGRRLRCVNGQCPTLLTDGKVYESLGPNTKPESEAVFVTADDGRPHSFWFSRFVPVEDEAPGFKAGDRVQFWDTVFGGDVPWQGLFATLARKTSGGCWLTDHETFQVFHPDNFRAAPPVAASPKVEHCKRCSAEACHDCVLGFDGNCGHCTADLMNESQVARAWDQAKYAGLDASTYQQLSTLDKRIAVARAELDLGTAERVKRMAGPGFPHEGHSDRVTGYRRWGQS